MVIEDGWIQVRPLQSWHRVDADSQLARAIVQVRLLILRCGVRK